MTQSVPARLQIKLSDFPYTVGDRFHFQKSIPVGFKKSPIKRGVYRILEVAPHPKSSGEAHSDYCYYFGDYSGESSKVEFIYNCVEWNDFLEENQNDVLFMFNRERFLKDVKVLLSKHGVSSLCINQRYDACFDEGALLELIVTFPDRFTQVSLGTSLRPEL